MPAQSGSSAALERMRRGYTREAYDDLVAHVRAVIPEVALRWAAAWLLAALFFAGRVIGWLAVPACSWLPDTQPA